MATVCCLCKFPTFTNVITSPPFSLFLPSTHFSSRSFPSTTSINHTLVPSSSSAKFSFIWDDALQISEPETATQHCSTYLQGFFYRVHLCNSASEKQSEFLPFVIDDHVVGFIHNGGFGDVFIFPKDKYNGSPNGEFVSLLPKLKTVVERTSAVGYVYGVQMNGYVELDGQKHLWIGKRSDTKSTYAGMLDELVAGGLNLVDECEEEAGIPCSISNKAIPVGAVSFKEIDGYRYKRDVLFCSDLKLPKDFVPKNKDGEVDSFNLIPVTQVAEIIRKAEFFKSNCSVVIIDFLIRHGYITPEHHGYLDLLRSLRIGDCS